MKFTEQELAAIDDALSVAADVYEADARAVALEGAPRSLVQQFQAQADLARRIADKIGDRFDQTDPRMPGDDGTYSEE